MKYQSSYTRVQLEALIDAVFDPEFAVLAAKAEQEGSSRGDPSLGNTILAMTADVRKAWSRLSGHDHDLIRGRYLYGLSYDVIAFLAGMDAAQEAADEVDAAIAEMLQFLNRFDTNEVGV